MPSLLNNIKEIAKDIINPKASIKSANTLSQRVAEAFQWTEGSANVQTVQIESGSIQIARGLLGPQPAAVFAVGKDNLTENLLNEAALYAYHASIPWGIAADREGALVFNSHWVRKNNWFYLPFIQWNDIEQNIDLFNAITPEGISQGHIEQIATKVYEPDSFLLPVDDALVERLDFWRAETLRFSVEVSSVDENLQTLFAQLFVLRMIEDRKIAPNLATLRSACTLRGEIDIKKLDHLLREAQSVIGSELFEFNALQHIPELVLGGIINDLYIPHNLPRGVGRYNFSWIDADVLGLAYEKYLSTILMPVPPPAQLRLFDQPNREVERISVRKFSGVYYTPNYLVQYLTERSLDHLNQTTNLDNLPRIADFACGSGSFLVAAVDSLIRRLRDKDPNRNWGRELVNGKHIVGVDIDERAVTIARLALWLRFAEEPQPLPLPRLSEIIVCGDALSSSIWSLIPKTYDIVLGNPPFIATGRTTAREELATRFRTAQGRYDYSYLFVETAVNHLNPSGILSMVLPNRLFRNRDANIIREILTAETTLCEVLDFGSNEVFEGTSAYIGTIIAQKDNSLTVEKAPFVRVINILDITSRFLAVQLMNASNLGSELRDETLVAYDTSHPQGGAPWLLISPSSRRNRMRLEENSELLSTIAGIYQGIRTGANDIFLVTIESIGEGPLARIINGLGDSGLIETALLHPVVFGSDIQKYESGFTNRYLIYPYRNGTVISEQELKSKFQETYKYFLRYRDVLAYRSSLDDSGLHWYELIRKRDVTWLQRPKLIIRDLATETSFAADELGKIFLVGGTAVVPADPDLLLPLLTYLNSNLVNQYLSQITPLFKSGFQKFEPQHIQRVPILKEILAKGELVDKLNILAKNILSAKQLGAEGLQRAAEEEIERLICASAGLTEQGLI